MFNGSDKSKQTHNHIQTDMFSSDIFRTQAKLEPTHANP